MNRFTIKKIGIILIIYYFGLLKLFGQDVTITVDVSKNKRTVSPYIYGRNNTFDKPVQFYKDAGLRFVRMNGGNNATKYNWRKKITSHPDWYNNVYSCDWDKTSRYISENFPNMQVMWAFQLLGRVASTNVYNFNDWEYNSSQWWEGVHQNLAGGGVPNTSGINPSKATVEGDANLYTEEWPADSTVEILNHWFGPNGIGLNKNQFLYWNMDNEPDIWNGTHDDVMSDGLLPASEFMNKYIEVAKKARALFPEIKICGPVTTSEWQWYKWGNENLVINGKYYCWLEYFIKRCADEEKASGVRVLDIVDIHHYPYSPTDNDALQNHRIFYDKDYVYPGANGIKTINGGWDNALNKEYIFQRIEDWLKKYFGENHGIKIGLSEWSPGPNDPNLASVIYATHLGLFANHGIEYFTPWNWFNGMWETLHLFSRYAKNYSVSSVSSLENLVSAYTTVNENTDSITIIIVNRDTKNAHKVTVNLNSIIVNDGNYVTLQLSSLPSNETFKSHTENALKTNNVTVTANTFTLNVPALSTTAVLLKSLPTGIEGVKNQKCFTISLNPTNSYISVKFNKENAHGYIQLFTINGKEVYIKKISGSFIERIDASHMSKGLYILKVHTENNIYTEKVLVY